MPALPATHTHTHAGEGETVRFGRGGKVQSPDPLFPELAVRVPGLEKTAAFLGPGPLPTRALSAPPAPRQSH